MKLHRSLTQKPDAQSTVGGAELRRASAGELSGAAAAEATNRAGLRSPSPAISLCRSGSIRRGRQGRIVELLAVTLAPVLASAVCSAAVVRGQHGTGVVLPPVTTSSKPPGHKPSAARTDGKPHPPETVRRPRHRHPENRAGPEVKRGDRSVSPDPPVFDDTSTIGHGSKVAPPSARLTDVLQNHWSYDAIHRALAAGLVVVDENGAFHGDRLVEDGISAGIFGLYAAYLGLRPSDGWSEPRLRLTRNQMAKALDDLFQQETKKFPGLSWPAAANFPDVPDTDWASSSLMLLKAAGICKGLSDGRWHGNRPVSKYELYAQLNSFVIRVQSLQDLLVQPFEFQRVEFATTDLADAYSTNDLPSTKNVLYRFVFRNRLAGRGFRFSKVLRIRGDWSIPPSSTSLDASLTISSQGPALVYCKGHLHHSDGTPYVNQDFAVTVTADGQEVGRSAVHVGQ